MCIERQPGLSCLGFVLRPTSEGSVEITSTDPDATLRLEPNYLTSDYDRETSAALVRRARETLRRVADRRPDQPRAVSGARCRSDDELVDAALDGGYSGYHAIGSCAMGPVTTT